MQVVTMVDTIHGDGITFMDWMKSYSPEEVGTSKYGTHQDWNIWLKGI
jgi:hypothetical protein